MAVSRASWRTTWNDATLAMGHAGTVRGWLRVCVPVVAGYVLGSIPTAVIVGRRRDVDVRGVGDRNPGWWNARASARVGGRRCRSSSWTSPRDRPAPPSGEASPGSGEWWPGYVGGAAAMVGHAWPLFAGFRGGRSVATLGRRRRRRGPRERRVWRSPPARSPAPPPRRRHGASRSATRCCRSPSSSSTDRGARPPPVRSCRSSALRFFMARRGGSAAAPGPWRRRRSTGRVRRRQGRRRAVTASRRRRARRTPAPSRRASRP